MKMLHQFVCTCETCQHRMDELLDIEKDDPPRCERCGSETERVPISMPTVTKQHSSSKVN